MKKPGARVGIEEIETKIGGEVERRADQQTEKGESGE
jgi:hypothetical protein